MKIKNTDWWLGFCTGIQIVVLLVFFLLLVLMLTAASANAQTWDWSPPAKYHSAVCAVTGETSMMKKQGSGVYIKNGAFSGVLTAMHVVSNTSGVKVRFQDGTEKYGESTICKFGYDVAFIFVVNAKIQPIELSDTPPKVGDKVEVIALGGPERNRLRTYFSNVIEVNSREFIGDSDVASGDSGGAIVNTDGKLVGICIEGRSPIRESEFRSFHGIISPGFIPIKNFVERVCNSRRGLIPVRRPRGFYPPSPTEPGKPECGPKRCPTPPPWLPPPSGPGGQTKIDYEKLAKEVIEKLDMSKLRGPVGPSGGPGLPGIAGAQGPAGPMGQLGLQGTAGVIDIDDIIKRINDKIKGSIRIKVRPIKSK